MDSFTDDDDEENSLGFYKGVMKLIAPELESKDDVFKDKSNMLDFKWAVEKVQENAFNAEVRVKKEREYEEKEAERPEKG